MDDYLTRVAEAVQTIQCNACDWIGSSADARYLGGRAPLGPLCPECGETTGPADDAEALFDATLTLMVGELRGLIGELIEALGGELPVDGE